MSLRILHTLPTARTRSERSFRDVIELSAAQRQFGHVIEIVTLDRAETDGLEELDVPIHRVARSRLPYGYNAEFVRWMKEHAAAYDCVIIHGLWEFNAYGAWLALRESDVPYFVFTHGMLDLWFKLHRPFQHIGRWLYWPWAGYPVLRDAHAVFFLSDYERHRAQEAFWLYDCHEFVVRYGTRGLTATTEDAEAFAREHPALAGRRLFTYFGDVSGRAGADAAIRAVAALRQRGLWEPSTMTLVLGDIPPMKQAILLDLIKRLDLGASVSWVGTLSGSARAGLLRASEALLRPSENETSGRVVVEALSVGTPALMAPGLLIWKDVVNDGAGLADEETTEGVGRLLGRWLVLSEDERQGMRRAARRCFEDRFALEGAANTLTAAIYLLVGVHRDGRWDLKPLKPASELL